MGYALFFARKLSLTTRVNNLNAELMSVSNAQMNLANQIANKQNAANLRSATNMASAADAFSKALESGGNYDAASAAYKKAEADNAMFTAQNDASLNSLQQKQNALDLQRETLETQLQAAQADLKSVEEAEKEAIKNSTAKYVG